MEKILKKPWLWIPPQLAHDLSPFALRVASKLPPKGIREWRPLHWRGLHFRNRLGIAGGVDKNGESLQQWWDLGAGFVEAGTVTPRPQKANPGTILRRQVESEALWNKMGFPNQGVDQLLYNLRRLPRPYPAPVFVNIGKNRDTSNEKAEQDYAFCIQKIGDLADAFVINISSPNTQDLRELQQGDHLNRLLREVQKANSLKIPILLKMSPDCEPEVIEGIAQASRQHGIDGWVVANTTRSRPSGIDFPEEGGLSGQPLAERSKKALKDLLQSLGDYRENRLVVSVGGVSTQQDVIERLELGADLVQLYSALIFSGPYLFRTLTRN